MWLCLLTKTGSPTIVAVVPSVVVAPARKTMPKAKMPVKRKADVIADSETAVSSDVAPGSDLGTLLHDKRLKDLARHVQEARQAVIDTLSTQEFNRGL